MGMDDVIDYALANTNVLYPPRVYDVTDIMDDKIPYAKGAFMAIGSKIESFADSFSPVLTCTKTINGAVGFFYPGVKERLAELYGGDYYVVFTSVSEARLHKVGTVDPRRLLQALKSGNRNYPGEMLSRKIYQYSGDKKELIQLML